MPRSIASDFYQSYRFAVSIGAPGSDYITTQNAGFNNITTPELSMESAEYREGTYVWTRKQAGVPSISDATFQQGISSLSEGGNGAPFMAWALAAINGAEYRTDITIYNIHRADVAAVRGVYDTSDKITTNQLSASRGLTLHEAYPIRVKPEADFDATSSEISIREMDVACEYISYGSDFQLIKNPGA